MDLHDFLATALDLLGLIEEIETRQARARDAVEFLLSAPDAPLRDVLLARLQAQMERDLAVLDRAVDLLTTL